MWRLARRSLRANRRRLVGTSLAVLFSVAFLSGTIVLGDTMGNGFDAAYGQFNSTTDVIVRSTSVVGFDDSEQRDPVPASLADELAGIDGVAGIALQIQGVTQLLDAAGEPLGGDGPPTVGASWIDGALNPFRIVEGAAPTAAGEVVIDRGTAAAAKLSVGSTTTALTPQATPVRIVGIAAIDEVESLGGATFTFFAPAIARNLLVGGRDEATAIVVSADDGVDPDALSRRVGAALPDNAEALTGSQLTQEQVDAIGADFLDFLRGFLLVFSGVAMLVATFSINNTFSVLIAQRSRESALLRAVGATRRQVLSMIATESAVLGLIASIVGTLAGVGLAQGLLSAFQALGLDLPTDGLTVNSTGLLVAASVGFVSTLVVGVFPAVEASRVPPIAALRSAAAEARVVSPVRLGVGTALGLIGLVALCAPALGWWSAPIAVTGAGATAVLVAMVVVGPGVARRAAAVIGAPVRRLRGVTGGLAQQNAMRSPRRTARTAGSLMVGVAVVTLFTVFGSSLVASVNDTVAGSLRSDFIVSSTGFSGPGLDPTLASRLTDLDEVEVATGAERGAVQISKTSIDIAAVDSSVIDQVLDAEVIEGSMRDIRGNTIGVAETLADEKAWSLGDEVPVTFADGSEQPMRVAAIFASAEILEAVVLDEATWATHRAQPSVRRVFVNVAEGVDRDVAREAIDAVGAPLSAPAAMNKNEFIDDIAGEISQTLSVIYVLLALSVIIALMGIANTISLSVHERRREIGLLRAVGQAQPQTRSMVRWEAAIISVFGTLGGVGVGLVAAWGLVLALGASDPELASFDAPIGQLSIIVVIGAVVGVLAGRRPARRAGRMDVLDALATT